jgi:hypothetical protein
MTDAYKKIAISSNLEFDVYDITWSTSYRSPKY